MTQRHGAVSTYRRGCHCDECTAANTAAIRRVRERKRYASAKDHAPIRRGPYGSSLPGLDIRTPPRPQALCVGEPPGHNRWFSTNRVDREAAKTICRQCPEQQACLAWALTHHEYGIWGGLTEDERDRRHNQQQEVAS